MCDWDIFYNFILTHCAFEPNPISSMIWLPCVFTSTIKQAWANLTQAWFFACIFVDSWAKNKLRFDLATLNPKSLLPTLV